MSNNTNVIVSQLVSARWWLVIFCAIAFLVLNITAAMLLYKKATDLDPKDIIVFAQSYTSLIAMVFAFYFTRADRNNGNGNGNGDNGNGNGNGNSEVTTTTTSTKL